MDLGIPRRIHKNEPDLQSELFSLGFKHLKEDRLDAVTHIVWYLCGPDGMELAYEALQTVDGREDHSYAVDLVFSAAAHAINRCDSCSPWHERFWTIFRRNRKVINMNASFAFGCQIPNPVADYLEWITKSEDRNRHEIDLSITKSRIGELYKPEHLDGFNLVDIGRVVPILKQVAVQDSKIKGRSVTPSLDGKRAAIQWMQCLGCEDVYQLSVSVAIEETNPYSAHGMAEFLSFSPQPTFDRSLCEQIVTAQMRDNDENEDFFRQSAVVQLAHASESREAFIAMTRFGYLHHGEVLLSFVNALADLAFARISQGDTDIFDRLLVMTSGNSASHHRKAGVSVLCRLASAVEVDSHVANQLWQFTNDSSLDTYSRSIAIIAVGNPKVVATEPQLVWLRTKAFSDDFEHQREALEGLFERGQVSNDDYPRIAPLLGARLDGGCFQVENAHQSTDWQAYMLGQIYRLNAGIAHQAVVSILEKAAMTAVHQLTHAIEEYGNQQPPEVLEKLRDRVVNVNTRGRADTELIRVLSAVSVNSIVDIVADACWVDWLEPARIALADGLNWPDGSLAHSDAKILSLFAALIRDPSVQVRRTAYRRFAQVNPDEFAMHLEMLASSGEPTFISRAAEGIRWLPAQEFSDNFVRRSALDCHVLPEVREIARDAITERRSRNWCREYMNEIKFAVKANRLDKREFRLAGAVKAIGDDETLQQLHDLLTSSDIKPRIRFWLEGLRKAVAKQWKTTLGKNAEPWTLLRGSVLMLSGQIVLPESSKVIEATVHLWKHERKNLTERYSWGGIIEPQDGSVSDFHDLGEVELRLPSREQRRIRVSASAWSSSHNVRLSFFSNDPWPEESAP